MSKCDILLECYFSFKLTLYISLYLKIAKLSLLECFIFHLGLVGTNCIRYSNYARRGQAQYLISYVQAV